VLDAEAAELVKNAERAVLAELKAEHEHSTYKVAGRAARPGTVVWDPERVTRPAALLSRLLKARVEVAGAEPPPDTVVPLPPVTVTPIRTVYAPGAVCVRCRDPTSPVPVGATLCDLCGYLAESVSPADECDPGLPGDFVHRGRAPLF
jgi:hypothetical protein